MFSWLQLLLVVIVAGAALCFAFVSGPPSRREDPPRSPAAKMLWIAVGVVLILVGALVCLLASVLIVLHGYAEAYDSGRASTLWFGVPILAVGGGLMALGISTIRGTRFPADRGSPPPEIRV